MKKTLQLKPLLLSMAVAASAAATVAPSVVQAGVSANVGLVSTYIYRGVQQTADASASAGIDYENESGIYIGLWGADVGGGTDGLEYDIYAGWAGEVEGVSLGLGATTYQYTGDFDTSYNEFNLSAGYGPIEVGYAGGKWEDGVSAGNDSDYSDMYITASFDSFSLTYGVWDSNTDVDDDAITRIEASYGFELAKGLDGSVTYINANPEDATEDAEDYFVFGVSKSFDLM